MHNKKERLPCTVFDLPVQELRRGYRSDVYFWRSKVSLEKFGINKQVTMQVFQKKSSIVCGIDEAIAILKLGSGSYQDLDKAYSLFDQLVELKPKIREAFLNHKKKYLSLTEEQIKISEQLDALWERGYHQLEIQALYDGDAIKPWETVMHITGPYRLFAHLETIYLGVLARRTRVATNVRRVVEAATGKPVLFFPARFDHWAVQGGDGYAAHVGGVKGVSTDAQGRWWGGSGAGTVPHALIAAMDGNTVEAVKIFGETYPDVNLVALVDFDNDVIKTSLECAHALGSKLWGVRVDTSHDMVDKSLFDEMGTFKPTGPAPKLIFKLRQALDQKGYEEIKIIVSGGFTAEKIANFEDNNVPVDVYGVGSAFLREPIDFTADVVKVEGKLCAKKGRKFIDNPRLVKVD